MFNFGKMLRGIGGNPNAADRSSGMGQQKPMGGFADMFNRMRGRSAGAPGQTGIMPGNPSKGMFDAGNSFRGNFNSGMSNPGIGENTGIMGGMVSPFSGGGSSPFAGQEGSIQNMFAPKKPNFFSSYFGR